jgi:hypothetical protein
MARLSDLSQAVRAKQELSPLEREMLGEMAGTLGRAGERVEVALAQMETLGDEADALAEAVDAGRADRRLLREKLVSFNLAVEHAEMRIWELIVQREALGIRRHEMIPRVYPVPRRRRVV